MVPLDYHKYFKITPGRESSFFKKYAYALATGGITVLLIGLSILQGMPSSAEAPLLNKEESTELINQKPSYHLVEPTIISNSGFLRGSCPSATSVITGSTLLTPINKTSSIGDYVPPNLVEIQNKIPTLGGKQVCLEETTAYYLQELFKAAQTDGMKLLVMSGYRSPSYQLGLYNKAIADKGYIGTLRVAPPYHSEHHINAVDFTTAEVMQNGGDLSATAEGKWLINHAGEFGFVMSYPEGKEEITGYQPEDWHWKFVGVENAKLIQLTGLTFHELATDPATRIISADEAHSYGSADSDTEIGG